MCSSFMQEADLLESPHEGIIIRRSFLSCYIIYCNVLCNCLYRLLNGNKLCGILPDELGNLQNLNRLQVDENELSGPIPQSFAKLSSAKHM